MELTCEQVSLRWDALAEDDKKIVGEFIKHKMDSYDIGNAFIFLDYRDLWERTQRAIKRFFEHYGLHVKIKKITSA